MLRRLIHGTVIGCACALVALVLWRAGALTRLEAVTWDLRARLLYKPEATTDSIRLIFLDQASLDWGKGRHWSWPWPRQVYAPVLDFCRRAGAKSVAFDVIFSEPSVYGVDDDAALGSAIAGAPRFVGAVFAGQEQSSETRWPADVPPSPVGLKTHGTDLANVHVLSHATFPVPDVATNAALLATVFGNPDPDGVYRRIRPVSVFDGRPVPSLGLACYLAAAPDKTLTFGDGVFSVSSRGGPLPLDPQGHAILRFRGPSQTHKTVNIAAVIESELRMKAGQAPVIDPAFLKDKYVLLGFTAPGLMDLRTSPVGAVYPGVEIHATFLDNLLAADFMRPTPPWMAAVLTLLLSMLGAVAIRLGRSAFQNALAFVLLVPLPALMGALAYAHGQWMLVALPTAGVLPAMIAALAMNYATEGREKRFIKTAFRQYVSPLVIDELVQQPGRLTLGGETRELSILFSDVRGFTSISEALPPESLTALLNEYLTAMTDIIYRHGGTVDKYEGDAVIAFWNAPLPQPDHALRAVRAALEYQSELARLRPGFRSRYGHELHARIGINTGPVVVGNMGSRQRFNYTFLGDAGNLAARLEGINKQFGTGLLISEATLKAAGPDVSAREIARVRVVGRRESIRVFEPIPASSPAPLPATLDIFKSGLAAYYDAQFTEARRRFSAIENTDAPAAAYARRCMELAEHPPAAWDGVWVMTEK